MAMHAQSSKCLKSGVAGEEGEFKEKLCDCDRVLRAKSNERRIVG
jgi:hypothetical protein